MKALVLAAGRGSRLHPYTEDCPKCLTVLGGQSLIGRQMNVLKAGGIDDIVIVAGYRAEMLRFAGTRQVVNDAWATTNMVESFFAAEHEFGDDLIVAYSDIIYQPRVLQALLDSDAEISVIVDKDWRKYWEFRFADPLSDAESLRMDADGKITEIGNKVKAIEKIQAQYIGLMRFKGDGLTRLREAYRSMQNTERPWKQKRPVEKAYMTDLLMEMILLGNRVMAVPISNGWLEIDTVSDYENAAAGFADQSILRFFDPRET